MKNINGVLFTTPRIFKLKFDNRCSSSYSYFINYDNQSYSEMASTPKQILKIELNKEYIVTIIGYGMIPSRPKNIFYIFLHNGRNYYVNADNFIATAFAL